MAEPDEPREGVLASLGRLVKTGLAMAQNRLDLLVVELREERWRLIETLLLVGLVLLLAAMALMAATVAIVMVCLEAKRLDLVIGLILIYTAGAIAGYWRLRVRMKGWAPFSATVGELKKDRACLDEQNWTS